MGTHLLRLVAGAASLQVAGAACRALLKLLGDGAGGGALTQAALGLPSGGGSTAVCHTEGLTVDCWEQRQSCGSQRG